MSGNTKKCVFIPKEKLQDSAEQARALAKASYEYLEVLAAELEKPLYREVFRDELLKRLSKRFIRRYDGTDYRHHPSKRSVNSPP
jgi:hypothetical protein